MVFVHAFAGGIAANLAISKKSLSDKQRSIIYALGIIGGIFPDVDIILLLLRVVETHRDLITHSFIPYSFGLLIWLVLTRKHEFLRLSGIVFYLGVATHLLLDMMTGALVALAPFSYQFIGFILPQSSTRLEWARWYLSSPTFMLGEASVIALYLLLIKNERNSMAKFLPWFFLLISTLMVGALLLV